MKNRNQCHSKKNGKGKRGGGGCKSTHHRRGVSVDEQVHTSFLGEEKHITPLCSTLFRNVQSMVYLPCELFRATLVVLFI